VKPVFILLAGPNGSGKTTLARTAPLLALDLAMVNPDIIAREAPAGVNALIWAGREVRRRVDALVASRKSFAVETTLAGNNHFRTIAACRDAGMHLALHYVFVRDIALSKRRVTTRVGLGGHDVPEEDQDRRFGRSLSNAMIVVKLMDESFFYDNSHPEGHQLVAQFRVREAPFISPSAPAWLKGLAPS
jgi:predicted ABC-type ATPase